MKKFLSNKYLQFFIRLIIGVIFIWASIGKILDPESFAKAIFRYQLLPFGLVNILSIILPFLEFFMGIFLLAGIYKKGSSFLIIIFLLIFTVALTSAYARGLNIDCGCFSLESVSSKGDILVAIFRDIAMLFGAIIVYLYSGINKGNKEFIIKENNKEGE